MSCALAGAEGLSGLTLAGLGGPWGVPVISSPALTVPPTPGTFYARERVAVLYGFVREALQSDWLPFELLASGGQKLSEDENLAFNECGLVSDKPPLPVLEGQLLAAWARAPHKGSALLRGAVLGAVLGAGRRQAPWASVLPSRLHGVTLRHLVSPVNWEGRWQACQCEALRSRTQWGWTRGDLLGRLEGAGGQPEREAPTAARHWDGLSRARGIPGPGPSIGGPRFENGLTARLGITGAAGITGGEQPRDRVALAPTRDGQREDLRSVL